MTIIKFESEDHNTESLNLGEGEVVMRAPHVVAFSRTATQNIMAFLEAMKAGESPPPLNKWESELFERTLPRIYELVKLREAFLKQSPSLWVLEEFIQSVLEIMRQLKLPDEFTPYQHDAYESASPPVGLPQYNQVDVNKYR